MFLIYALIVNVALSFFARGGYEYMLSMINALQIILHLPIFNVAWPAPIMEFYKVIIPFVMFDIIESFESINDLFVSAVQWEDGDNDELNIFDQVQTLGYDSHNPLLNIGTMSILLVLYVLKCLILFTCIYPNKQRNKRCRKAFLKMKESMFYGEILAIFIETHLELCLAGILLLQVTQHNQDNNAVMWAVGVLFLFISFVLPVNIIWILC